MAELTLYTRAGCGLCDRLKSLITSLMDDDSSLSLSEVDIANDPGLIEQFGLRIPVVMYAGRVILEGRPSLSEVRTVLDPLLAD